MIDREKVIKGLKAHGYTDCKYCPYWGTGHGGLSECTQLARDALALLEAQEPVVHGRWIDIPDKPEWDQKMCSVCGDYRCCQGNYCPNCGAKMEDE